MKKQSIDDFHVLTLHAGYSEHNADWNWSNVRSPFARLYFVTEGEAQVVFCSQDEGTQDEVVDLRPYHMYLIPPFTKHRYVCKGRFSHYYIHLFENSFEDSGYLSGFDFPREMEGGDVELQLFRHLCETNPFFKLPESNPQSYDNNNALLYNLNLNRQRPLADKVESRGILYILMSKFFRHATPKSVVKDERILRAIGYMRQNIEAAVTVEELAGVANMSKDHFIRTFRKEVGNTPVSYMTQIKIERAEVLLITTPIPVKNISSMLGFDDYSYFIRVFRKKVGTTPQAYRKEG